MFNFLFDANVFLRQATDQVTTGCKLSETSLFMICELQSGLSEWDREGIEVHLYI